MGLQGHPSEGLHWSHHACDMQILYVRMRHVKALRDGVVVLPSLRAGRGSLGPHAVWVARLGPLTRVHETRRWGAGFDQGIVHQRSAAGIWFPNQHGWCACDQRAGQWGDSFSSRATRSLGGLLWFSFTSMCSRGPGLYWGGGRCCSRSRWRRQTPTRRPAKRTPGTSALHRERSVPVAPSLPPRRNACTVRTSHAAQDSSEWASDKVIFHSQ